MYRIKSEKVEELKEGKTIVYLSKIIGYSRPYLNDVFTGKMLIEKEKVSKILLSISKESYKLNKKIAKNGVDITIDYFFKKID